MKTTFTFALKYIVISHLHTFAALQQ